MDEYDRRTLYIMFLKCYHHLHPMIESVGCVNQTSDENFSLYIFQQDNGDTSQVQALALVKVGCLWFIFAPFWFQFMLIFFSFCVN